MNLEGSNPASFGPHGEETSPERQPIRIVYAGYLTEPLKALLSDNSLHVVAVVGEPQRERTQHMMELLASLDDSPPFISLNPERDIDEQLAHISESAHVGVLAGFGFILTNALRAPLFGWLNIHPGSLPEFAGNRPIEMQILSRQPGVTVTVHHAVEEVDGGPVLFMAGRRLPSDFTYHRALAEAMDIVAPEICRLIHYWCGGGSGFMDSASDKPVSNHGLSLKTLRESSLVSLDDAIALVRICEEPVHTTWEGHPAILRSASKLDVPGLQKFPSDARVESDLVLDLHEQFVGTSIAIMQPHFLPWLGYFDMMNKVDVFVFLDDVQLSKQSHQTRNIIGLKNGDFRYISLPHHHSSSSGKKLNEIEVANPAYFLKKLLRQLCQEYDQQPLLSAMCDLIKDVLEAGGSLAQTNIDITLGLADLFGLQVNAVCSSDIATRMGRVERLNDIFDFVGASTYVASEGARAYMEREGRDAFHVTHVRFNRFESPYGRVRIAGSSHTQFPSALHEMLFWRTNPRTLLSLGRKMSIPW